MHSARNAGPVGFGGDSYFGGELCFGGEAGSDFGVVNGPRSKLLVEFRGLESPILQGRGTTHELRLVTLNCDRMVDKRRHPVAFHCYRSTASLPSLHYRCSMLHGFIAVAACLAPTNSTKRDDELKAGFT